MNKHLLLLTLNLALCCMMFSTSAQETAKYKKGIFEIGIGMNFFGPKLQMADLMTKYGFDDENNSWLSSMGSSPPNPHYSKVGFTGMISYSYNIAPRSQLGILLNYSYLDAVSGFSSNSGYLTVSFSNISLVPVYKLKVKENTEFLAGPAIMINRGNKTNEDSDNTENYTKLSFGLLMGMSVNIWDSQKSYGKIGAYYLLTYKNKMGPYTSSDSMNERAIPEDTFNFSHLNIILAIGFKK